MIEPREAASKAREVLGLLGFLLVATAQVSNMILARGVRGKRSAVLIAFFRWSIVALGLLPAVAMALREKPGVLQGRRSASSRPVSSACSSVEARSMSPALRPRPLTWR